MIRWIAILILFASCGVYEEPSVSFPGETSSEDSFSNEATKVGTPTIPTNPPKDGPQETPTDHHLPDVEDTESEDPTTYFEEIIPDETPIKYPEAPERLPEAPNVEPLRVQPERQSPLGETTNPASQYFPEAIR